MKNRKFICGLLLALVAVSCNKDSRTGTIRFLANTAGFEEKDDTRTVFTGTKVGDVERIDWSEGDILRIYCGEATMLGSSNQHECDYTVSASSSSGSAVCTASINPATDVNGMQWGENEHTFYAMYPSPDTDGLVGASFENGTMVFTMPATQTVTRKENTGIWLPDMKYAPMLAVTTVNAYADSVPLDFSPKYSAFSFTVKKAKYAVIHLSSFTLTSATGYLTGTYTLEAGAYTPDGGVSNVTNGGKSITVDLNGVVLDADTPDLTFTVLAGPQYLSGLVIGFTGEEIGTRTLALNRNGNPLPFAAYKKYNIKGLSFPDGIVTLDGINWDGTITGPCWNISPINWNDWGDGNRDSDMENVHWKE